MAVCVKYLDKEYKQSPCTKLFCIIPILTSSTGETIYKLIKDNILYEEVLQENLMGIVTDEGRNFSGKNVGVGKRLKDDFKHITNVNDLSHIFNDVLKKALKAFPQSIQDVITDISAHFHYSTQRCAVLREIQKEMNMSPLEILHMTKTRWLTLRNTLDRILELWPCLQSYFDKYGNSGEKTYCSINNEAGLRILSLLVGSICKYNEYFQRDDLYYNQVLEQIKEGFVVFTKAIIKKDNSEMDLKKTIELPFKKLKDEDILKGEYHTEIKSHLFTTFEFEANFLKKIRLCEESYCKNGFQVERRSNCFSN